MAARRRSRFSLLLLAALLCVCSGCLMPRRGTPVFVDLRAGDFWSGNGLLLEVSEDRSLCKVAVRDRALMVRKLWVDCAWIHPQSTR